MVTVVPTGPELGDTLTRNALARASGEAAASAVSGAMLWAFAPVTVDERAKPAQIRPKDAIRRIVLKDLETAADSVLRMVICSRRLSRPP
jgi:hypothetical protein